MLRAPIFVLRQWMRHRMASYNEMSGRYTEFEDDFFRPDVWRKQKGKQTSDGVVDDQIAANICMEEAYEVCYSSYLTLLQIGVAKEQARMVLPVSMMSKMYVSTDLRNWLGFLKLRCDEHAQHEIRECANQIRGILEERYPIIMSAWEDYHFNAISLSQQAQCELKGKDWEGSNGEIGEVTKTLERLK